MSGINHRNNLLQVNVAKQRGINYRLVELGFIDNQAEMTAIRTYIDDYCEDLADAITGSTATVEKPVKVTTGKPTKSEEKERDTWGWHWSFTFNVLAEIGLQVYRGNQFMRVQYQVDQTSNLEEGEWCNSDHLFLINGHWVARFKYAAKGSSTDYFFVPIGKKKHGQTFEQAIKATDLWVDVEKINTNGSKSGVTNWHKKRAAK